MDRKIRDDDPVMAEEAITATAGLPVSGPPRPGKHVIRYNRKIAVMGYPCVGKSSITLRFVNGNFPEAYDTTIEDLHTKVYHFKGREYALRITDTAGQQEYSIFPRSCSVDIDGFILVYAIDDRKSFEIIQTIHDKIIESVGDRNVPVVVVGNKLDLQYSCRAVSREEGAALAQSWGGQFVEISAKELSTIPLPSGPPTRGNKPPELVKVADIFDRMLLLIEVAKGNINPNAPPNKRCSIM